MENTNVPRETLNKIAKTKKWIYIMAIVGKTIRYIEVGNKEAGYIVANMAEDEKLILEEQETCIFLTIN